jgi:tetratricopeptide (TPR) repeat protein
MKYTAVNNETGEVEEMPKVQRDLMIKAKSHSNPKDERTPSKKAEIVKNIALIYLQLEQDDKALAAFKEARAQYPNDVNLILNEANIHLKLDNKDKFKELMNEAVTIAPDNPDLHYNIGVISMEQGDYEACRKAYNKALEIDPKYENAILNLSVSYTEEGNSLIEEMNALGNSRADIQKYDALKAKKDSLFEEGAKVLENGLKSLPSNAKMLEQLKNIYGALGDTANYKRVKDMIEQ